MPRRMRHQPPPQVNGSGDDWIDLEKSKGLTRNDGIVESVHQCLTNSEFGLKHMPVFLKNCIRDNCWQKRYCQVINEVVEFGPAEFVRFVESHPPQGLGTTVDVLKEFCRKDMEALDMIDAALRQEPGVNQHAKGFDNVQPLPSAPTGNSADRALRKLRTASAKSLEVKAIYQRVLAGEISPHRGMIEAGFRKVLTPLEQIRKLANKLTPEERQLAKEFFQE